LELVEENRGRAREREKRERTGKEAVSAPWPPSLSSSLSFGFFAPLFLFSFFLTFLLSIIKSPQVIFSCKILKPTMYDRNFERGRKREEEEAAEKVQKSEKEKKERKKNQTPSYDTLA